MRTVFIGGGRGCRAVLELMTQGSLAISAFGVRAIVDRDSQAPAMQYAREQGWMTLVSVDEALELEDVDLIVELTGSDDVVEQIYRQVRPGVRVMDHVMARVFWDLEKVSQAQGVQLDERIELERRAAQERNEIQVILDNLPDVILLLDRHRHILRVNRRFEELTGKRRIEVEGKSCDVTVLYPRGGVACADCPRPCQHVIETGQQTSRLVERHSDDGVTKHYQVNTTPIFDADGAIVQLLRTSREITEQVRLKRQTEEWAQRFRQIVNSVHSLITIKDRHGRYRLVNPSAAALFGMSQAQMLGKTDAELFPAVLATTLTQGDQRARQRSGYYGCEETLQIGDRVHHIVAERYPLADAEGRLVDLCCVGRDETQERNLQEDLVRSERLAAIGKLAAGVAHELNNPLTGILTFAEDLLEESAPEDPLRADYELIMNETMRCRRIVRDLLDFARQKAPERQRSNLNDVVRRAVAMVERQATFHNVQLEIMLGELEAVDIDSAQMQQVVLNLIINAKDALGDASGTVRVATRMAGIKGMTPMREMTWQSPNVERVLLEVIDDGCGIAADDMGAIFEPFFSTKGEQGNGLGLPVVKSVVEQHGGRIEVESTVGVGTSFRIHLPVSAAATES